MIIIRLLKVPIYFLYVVPPKLYCFHVLSLFDIYCGIQNFRVFFQNYEVKVKISTGKPGKMGVHFAVREKSGTFIQIYQIFILWLCN